MDLSSMNFVEVMTQFLQAHLEDKEALHVIGISAVIMLIFIIIFASRLNSAMRDADENAARINQYIAVLPPEKVDTVMAIYQNTRKEIGFGIVLCLVGSLFAAQRIYLGKTKSAVLCLFFFWTGIPIIISLFDLMSMPRTISQYNLGVVQSLYNQLAAPKID